MAAWGVDARFLSTLQQRAQRTRPASTTPEGGPPMTPVYATADDYLDEYGTAPDNVARLLKSASRLVRGATACDLYAVDTDSLPTDTGLLAAFRDATLAQAAAWAAISYDPIAGGVVTTATKLSKSLDGASVTYADAAAAAAARARATDELVPEAAKILKQAGLATSQPGLSG